MKATSCGAQEGRLNFPAAVLRHRPQADPGRMTATSVFDEPRAPRRTGQPGVFVMAAKEVRFSVDARDKMLRGIDILTHAVRVTLGPKGRNVVLDKSFGAPRISKDGVTVAKEIELEDKFENMGAQMVREVASKTSGRLPNRPGTAPRPRRSSPTPSSRKAPSRLPPV